MAITEAPQLRFSVSVASSVAAGIRYADATIAMARGKIVYGLYRR